MANIDISTELEAIMAAIYGEQVRGSIHDALQKMAVIIRDEVISVDPTLTVSGAAADAKVVGDTVVQVRDPLANNTDLNNVLSTGLYKLKRSGEYVNSPLSGSNEGWLNVYGNTTTGYTQEVTEFGTDSSKTYYTWRRHCNTSSNTFVWGVWQKTRSETDPLLIEEGVPADAKVVGETTLRFHGVLDDQVDFNSVWNSGIYRISSARNYTHSPLENSKTGWLVVYKYGSTGISITQHVFESGINNNKTYLTYMRSANTTNYPYTWGDWQTSTIETDETLSVSGSAADAKVVGDKFKNLEYVPVDITSFSVSPSEAEVGSTVTQVTLTYNINQVPASLVIAGESITPAASGTVTKSGLTLRTNTSWQIVARDAGCPAIPLGNSDNATASLTFKYKQYWGARAIPADVNSAFINALDGALATSRGRTFTTSPGANQYIWFASPTSFGACSFKDAATNLSGGFTLVGTIQHTNASGGGPVAYYVYRSNQPNLGNVTFIVS